MRRGGRPASAIVLTPQGAACKASQSIAEWGGWERDRLQGSVFAIESIGAVGTILAVVVAALSVRQAASAQKDATIPVLDFTLVDYRGIESEFDVNDFKSPDHSISVESREFGVDVVNQGVGPAVFVDIRWTRDRDSGVPLGKGDLEPSCELLEPATILTLGAGHRRHLRFRTPWIPDPVRPPGHSPRASYGTMVGLGYLRATYRDVHDRTGVVAREIELNNEWGPTRVALVDNHHHEYQPPGKKPLRYSG